MATAHRVAITRALVRAARATGQARRPRKKLPRQQPPTAIERAYAGALGALVGARVREAFARLNSELPGILVRSAAQRRDSASSRPMHTIDLHADGGLHRFVPRLDAGEGKEARDLISAARDRLTTSLNTGDIEDLAAKFAAQTSSYQRVQLGRQTEAALGVNVLSTDRTTHHIADAFIDSNVALIKGLADKVAADVQSTIFRAIQDGKLHPDIAKDLASRYGFAESRAKLIARDQVGKLYGQINVARQKDLGVGKFVWRTVGDDRVRDEHADRDGETYSFDDPPAGELPGEPVLCRCWAEPVFDDVMDTSDHEVAIETPPETDEEERATLAPDLAQMETEQAAAEEAVRSAVEEQHEGFRIGVSSEITGALAGEIEAAEAIAPFAEPEMLPAFAELATPALETAISVALPAPANVLIPSPASAPIGYASYTFNGETYLQHAVGGGPYMTPAQLADYSAGRRVVLAGPNQQFPGFNTIALKGHGVRFETEEWIGQHKMFFTAAQIENGEAARDINWLVAHETAAARKPSLGKRLLALVKTFVPGPS